LAVLRHAEEVTASVPATCRHYGISRQVFYTWRHDVEIGHSGVYRVLKRQVDQTDNGAEFQGALHWHVLEDFYNFNRPHGSLDGQTRSERLRQKTTASA
jgi:hypothetical protein